MTKLDGLTPISPAPHTDPSTTTSILLAGTLPPRLARHRPAPQEIIISDASSDSDEAASTAASDCSSDLESTPSTPKTPTESTIPDDMPWASPGSARALVDLANARLKRTLLERSSVHKSPHKTTRAQRARKPLGEGQSASAFAVVISSTELNRQTEVVVKVPKKPTPKNRETQLHKKRQRENPNAQNAGFIGSLHSHPAFIHQTNGELNAHIPLIHTCFDTDAELYACHFIAHTIKAILSILNADHHDHYAHRDIKPDNIFLDSDMRPVIGDYGCTQKYNGKPVKKDYYSMGAPSYQSPEIIIDGWNCTPKNNQAWDIWATGTVMSNLLDYKTLLQKTIESPSEDALDADTQLHSAAEQILHQNPIDSDEKSCFKPQTYKNRLIEFMHTILVSTEQRAPTEELINQLDTLIQHFDEQISSNFYSGFKHVLATKTKNGDTSSITMDDLRSAAPTPPPMQRIQSFSAYSPSLAANPCILFSSKGAADVSQAEVSPMDLC